MITPYQRNKNGKELFTWYIIYIVGYYLVISKLSSGFNFYRSVCIIKSIKWNIVFSASFYVTKVLSHQVASSSLRIFFFTIHCYIGGSVLHFSFPFLVSNGALMRNRLMRFCVNNFIYQNSISADIIHNYCGKT